MCVKIAVLSSLRVVGKLVTVAIYFSENLMYHRFHNRIPSVKKVRVLRPQTPRRPSLFFPEPERRPPPVAPK